MFLKAALEKILPEPQVLHAPNGRKAVDMVQTNPAIDLVLMDLKMPVMNGVEATRLIKAARPDLPVIVQTAYAAPENMAEATDAGCDIYLKKPIGTGTLRNAIQQFVPVLNNGS